MPETPPADQVRTPLLTYANCNADNRKNPSVSFTDRGDIPDQADSFQKVTINDLYITFVSASLFYTALKIYLRKLYIWALTDIPP